MREVEERDDESRQNNMATMEEILDYCKEVDADLIVMGSQGETEIEDLLIGSVAETVLENSEIPVLTVTERTVSVEKFLYFYLFTLLYSTLFPYLPERNLR